VIDEHLLDLFAYPPECGGGGVVAKPQHGLEENAIADTEVLHVLLGEAAIRKHDDGALDRPNAG
jgi:hypothetical protein